MDKHWYSRQYLGKHFDNFLKSDMNSTDFMQLQEVLQQVLVQLRARNNFIASGYPNKIGGIHTKRSARKESLSMMNQKRRLM